MARVLGGLPFLAIAILFAYEWMAVTFALDPSLSKMMAYTIDSHNPRTVVAVAFLLGGTAVTLVFHFTGSLPWWRP